MQKARRIGHLGKDSEMEYTAGGTAITTHAQCDGHNIWYEPLPVHIPHYRRGATTVTHPRHA